MANERNCAFCGEKLGLFQLNDIRCGDTLQMCCKTCVGEMARLTETERCRRALRLGFAVSPEKLQAYVDRSDKAEARRPACLHCGTKLRFMAHQYLDNSPVGNGRFTVIPAYCPDCGQYVFYRPEILEKDEQMAFLVKNDTGE